MAKSKTAYECSNCGARQPKWAGQCDGCKEWNTLSEVADIATTKAGRSNTRSAGSVSLQRVGSIKEEDYVRIQTGIGEFDRVLGGKINPKDGTVSNCGLVPGSSILIGGDPGIGKSTLLMQAASKLAIAGKKVAYISGEENEHQVQMRATRLGYGDTPLFLSHEKDAGAIASLIQTGQFDLVIVDSIQTVYYPQLDAPPSSQAQVKACTIELTAAAKQSNTAVILVGHVTKDGVLAGPHTIKHLTDAHLEIFSETSGRFRILRASKNRFGSVDEIGVFEMAGEGMMEVTNPSGVFIEDRAEGLPGSVIYPALEGTRPLLLEIQALVAPNPAGSPTRVSIGFDRQRLSMILAVLETRVGLSFSGYDVYLNVAGGYKVTDPAADLAVACAIISAHRGEPFEQEAVAMGEIGLGGEVRPIPRVEQRLRESTKLGFPISFIPKASVIQNTKAARVKHLKDVLQIFKYDHLRAA